MIPPGVSHLHLVCVCVRVYLGFSDEGPQLSALSPLLCPVVEVTGFRDAPPHGGAVVFKFDITRGVES